MKIALLGNCQVGVYNHLLKHMFPDSQITVCQIHQLNSREYPKIYKSLKSSDVVITQNITSKYGILSTAILRKKIKKLAVIHNLYFKGLHPYFGYISDRIQSPLGDYNSEIIYDSYINNESEGGALERFLGVEKNDVTVRKVWVDSFLELLNRELLVDVPFAQEVEFLTKEEPTFYTFNHPRLELVYAYLKKILTFVDIQYKPLNISEIEDPLKNDAILPINSQVIEVNNLGYRPVDIIKSPSRLGGRTYTVERFIRESYKIYNEQNVKKAI